MQSLRLDHEPRPRWSADGALDWARLDFQQIAPVVKTAMADAYGQILRAEQVGLRAVRRLAEAAPEGALRDLARAQLEDELRHVEFFSRIAAALGAPVQPSPSLELLDREISSARGYDAIMMLTQVMENAANALFNGHARQSLKLLKKNVRLPGSGAVEALLSALVALVGKDEGAHVAAGMRILRRSCAGIGARERHVLEERVQVASALMLSACADVGKSYRRLGFGEHEVLDRIALAQQRYWHHFAIEAQPSSTGRPDHG